MSGNARFWLLIIGGVVLAALVVGGAGTDGPPLDPRSVNPDGTRGLVEVLEDLGASVDFESSTVNDAATTALLLTDRLSPDDRDSVDAWIRRGGTLVVADPSSSFAARPGGFSRGEAAGSGCPIGPLGETLTVTVDGRWLRPEGASWCIGEADEAFLVVEPRGDGTVVSLGGATLFTNAELDRLDNAFVAIALLAPDPEASSVVVLRPSVIEFGDRSAAELVSPQVRNGIIMLLAAFLLYALYRLRRLGRVVHEPLPVRIEGSELVLQAGVLSQRAKDPAGAAEVIRADARRRWRKALASEDTQLVERLVGATGFDHDQVTQALHGVIADDSALVDAVTTLDLIDAQLRTRTLAPEPAAPEPV